MKNWWKRFRKFSVLSFKDKILIVQAFIIISCIKISLRLLSFQRFRDFYKKVTYTSYSAEIPVTLIDKKVWAIQRVAGILSAFCLPQALALTYFLRTDKQVVLRVGVSKQETFEAHAWVEKKGKILIGELPGTNFQPLWNWQ